MTLDLEAAPSPEIRLWELVDMTAVENLMRGVAGGRLAVVDAGGAFLAGQRLSMERDVELRSALLALSKDAALTEAYLEGRLLVLPLRLPRAFLGGVVVVPDASLSKGDGEVLRTVMGGLGRVIEGWARSAYELQSTVGELVWRYEELSVLYDAAETIVSVMDLDEVSKRILLKASDMLEVENASLMLLDADSSTLRIQDALGLDREQLDTIRLRPGEEISGWVAREGKPLLIEDIESHPLFKKVNKERHINRSLLSVPLKIKDRVIGVLNVNNKKSGQVFNSGDLKILSALASLAAISIDNAHTYKNAITDRLTRLYNYGYFREELGRRIEQAMVEEMPVSLLMFDIDHFKNFNDKNGHELANVALVRVAQICMENSRQKGDRMPDVVARYGGEEFMIVLYGVTRDQAYKTAERVRTAIYETDFKGGENQPNGRLSISMGVACYPQDAADGDELTNAADRALYRAKKAGRNNVQMAGEQPS